MSDWLKSVFKNVLKAGLKLVETILKPIISKIFDLKEIKEIVNDPILDRDEKTNEIKKIIYGSNDDLENIINQKDLLMLLIVIILSIGVTEIKISFYQLKSISKESNLM